MRMERKRSLVEHRTNASINGVRQAKRSRKSPIVATRATKLVKDEIISTGPCPMEQNFVFHTDSQQSSMIVGNTETCRVSQADESSPSIGGEAFSPRSQRLVTPPCPIVGPVVDASHSQVRKGKLSKDITVAESISSSSSMSSLEVEDSTDQSSMEPTPLVIHVEHLKSEASPELAGVSDRIHYEPSQRQGARPVLFVFLLVLLTSAVGVLLGWHDPNVWNDVDPSAIFVPGAGFSGFWFTLGRLHSISDPASKTYYCYSAGCLGVVASLSNFTVDEMADIAFSVQDKWKSREIGRHGVVDDFVDRLLYSDRVIRPMEVNDLLSRVKIITTVRKGWLGLQPCVRSPTSIERLREMLLQTTWIPFAVGHSMWHQDSISGDHHLDGAFSILSHPRLSRHLHLPIAWEVIRNVLNVNLGRDMVKKLWNDGVGFGA